MTAVALIVLGLVAPPTHEPPRHHQLAVQTHRREIPHVWHHRVEMWKRQAERIAASRSRGVASAVESSSNPAYSSATAGTGTAPAGVDWYAIASCESNGSGGPPDWAIDTGNGYYGGLQFDLSTWQANGGVGNPAAASPAAQVAVAERVYAQVGLSAWPVCQRYAYR